MEALVVYITAPNEDEAAKIARVLVEERLAACVNIVPGIRSFYFWKDRIEDEKEVLMIVKTRLKLFKQLKVKVLDMHTYEVPEIIALPIVDGSDDYINWLKEVTTRSE